MAKSIFAGKSGIIIPLILAAVGVVLIFQYIKTTENKLGLSAELVTVLVASGDIPAYTKLDSTMVKPIKVPRKFVQPSAIGSVNDINYRVTLIPLLKGEHILSTMLSEKGQSAGLALKVRKGYRAVSVGVDAITGVSGLIRPGDKVDVLATFEFDGGSKNLEKRTYTILQNINVLAVGQNLGADSMVEAAFDSESSAEMDKRVSNLRTSAKRKHKKMHTITLLVNPTQAQKVALTQATGAVFIALCPIFEDKAGVKVQSMSGKDMLGIEDPIYMPKQWSEIRGTVRQ